MPAKSKSQQRLFGMVHAYKTGRLEKSDVDSDELWDKIKKIAKGISDEDAKDFAETGHEGLPNRVEEIIRNEIRKQLRESYRYQVRHIISENTGEVRKWEYYRNDDTHWEYIKDVNSMKMIGFNSMSKNDIVLENPAGEQITIYSEGLTRKTFYVKSDFPFNKNDDDININKEIQQPRELVKFLNDNKFFRVVSDTNNAFKIPSYLQESVLNEDLYGSFLGTKLVGTKPQVKAFIDNKISKSEDEHEDDENANESGDWNTLSKSIKFITLNKDINNLTQTDVKQYIMQNYGIGQTVAVKYDEKDGKTVWLVGGVARKKKPEKDGGRF